MSNTDAFPAGLDGMYGVYFGRLLVALKGDKHLYQSILGPVVVAREPLQIGVLKDLLGKEDLEDVKEDVRKARNLLYLSQDRLGLLHKTMADWLQDGDKSGDLRIRNLKQVHHKNLGDWCFGQRGNAFAYAHAIYHLGKSGQHDKVQALLLDCRWLLGALRSGVPCVSLVLDADEHWHRADDSRDAESAADVVRALEKSLVALNHDHRELASQLIGRLDANNPVLEGIDQLYKDEGIRWLKPVRTSLTPARNALRKIFRGHSSLVTSVAFSPDGKTIVSGSWDKTVRLWSVQTGEQLKVLEGHSSEVKSVAFSPDGKTVMGKSSNSTLYWSVEDGAAVERPSNFDEGGIDGGVVDVQGGVHLRTNSFATGFTTDDAVNATATNSHGDLFVGCRGGGAVSILCLQ